MDVWKCCLILGLGECSSDCNSLFRGMSHALPLVRLLLPRELLPKDLNIMPDLVENLSISFVLALKGIMLPFKFSYEFSLYFPAVCFVYLSSSAWFSLAKAILYARFD